MTVAELVAESARRLVAPGQARRGRTRARWRVQTPDHAAHEARELLAAVLDVPRSWAHTNATRVLTPSECAACVAAVERRLDGMPLAYAARSASFRALNLYVDERVLIPRPETEQLVDLVLAEGLADGGTAIDIGTGSGAIALSLAKEGRFARVVGTDVSADALAVAAINRARAGLIDRVALLQGSILAPCRGGRARVVVSNPPYISFVEAPELPEAVRDWEPPVALFAGAGGMSVIAAVAHEAADVLEVGGLLALEVDSRRAGSAANAVGAVPGYERVEVRPDLTGRARFVLARRMED